MLQFTTFILKTVIYSYQILKHTKFEAKLILRCLTFKSRLNIRTYCIQKILILNYNVKFISITKVFLSWFYFSDENNSLSQTIPDKPIELRHFVKLCDQRRKFPVLYKLEFQVSNNLYF